MVRTKHRPDDRSSRCVLLLDPSPDASQITKTWLDGPDGTTFWHQVVVRTDSEDFVQWSKPRLVSAPAEVDVEELEELEELGSGLG